MDDLQHLLQVSAKLYQHLTHLPKEAEREEYIEKVNGLLGERGEVMEQIKSVGFIFDNENKSHVMLAELDKGIRERLKSVMELIKSDLRELQVTKKNEKLHLNPYSSVAVMDGRYYDKKN